MCSRTQYKRNVLAAVQCVEVSWTSAFLLPSPDGRTFQSLRSFSIERRPTRYDLRVSVLQELCVGLVVFIKLERVPWFRVRKIGMVWGPRGWPPQFQLRLVRLYVAGFNLTVESECVFKTSSNWVLHLSSCIQGRIGGSGIGRYFSIRVQILQPKNELKSGFPAPKCGPKNGPVF